MENNIPQTDNFSGERYVSRQTQSKRRNKPIDSLGWRFTIVRNYVRHDRGFRTFEEAVAYKYKYLNLMGVLGKIDPPLIEDGKVIKEDEH